MNHAKCARARWTREDGYYRCASCGTPLGLGGDERSDVHILTKLVPLKLRHGDLATFGPPDRVRLKGRTARSGSFVPVGDHAFSGPHEGPVYVYCPRAGICGKGQHLDLPQ